MYVVVANRLKDGKTKCKCGHIFSYTVSEAKMNWVGYGYHVKCPKCSRKVGIRGM